MLKKILPFVIFILLVFTAVVLYNTMTFKSKQISVEQVAKRSIKESAIQHFSEAVSIKTVAARNLPEFDSASFHQFSNFLQSSYPNVESNLDKLSFNNYSYLYSWEGSDEKLKPLVLLAHMDVFPVPSTQLPEWTLPPFSGEISSGALWGRGTLHGKVRVIGLMEAVEHLLEEGFTPKRTIYLAFGHDRTIGGLKGAQAIAHHMMAAGIKPGLVLDGGYTISRGLVPGLLTNVAQIGTAETGFVSLVLSIELEKEGDQELQRKLANRILERAVVRLQRNSIAPQLTASVDQFIEFAGPETRFQTKMMYANKRLFRSTILDSFQQSGKTGALVQTTMISSLLDKGIIEAAETSDASSTIHYSILPGSSVEAVVSHVKKTINDERIHIKVLPLNGNPILASEVNTNEYFNIVSSIQEIFSDVICLPNLSTEAGDSRYFYPLCKNIYRFSPVRFNPENNPSILGVNEHIQLSDLRDVIRFYIRIIENFNDKDNF